MTKERCTICDEPTGHAGRGDDSIYIDLAGEEIGPLCDDCSRIIESLAPLVTISLTARRRSTRSWRRRWGSNWKIESIGGHMKTILTNAFSINMLPRMRREVHFRPLTLEEAREFSEGAMTLPEGATIEWWLVV